MTMTAAVVVTTSRKSLVALVVCVPLLSGCMGSDPVKEKWAARDSVRSCGSVRLHQGQELERDGDVELACLRRALDSGRGAELSVRYPTVEGDPITDYYRVNPDGTTEVYTDATEDAYGDGKWGFATCEQPTSVLDVNC